jgi:hypothetical protein
MDLIEDTTQHFVQPRKNDAHIQRKRWDAFFEPQYSFGQFIHGSNQPIDNHHEHRRNLDRLIDDGNNNIKSPLAKCSMDIPSPVLPGFTTPVTDLNRTSITEAQLDERLKLLKKIRNQEPQRTESTRKVVRWKLQLTEKARQWRKEVKGDDFTPDSSPDLEKEMEEEQTRHTSRSLLCFVLGFLFPPFWLLGAFYISSYANKQTSANRRIDHVWRHRNRVAFGIFIILLMIILVIVFVVKPESVGWRRSSQQVDLN